MRLPRRVIAVVLGAIVMAWYLMGGPNDWGGTVRRASFLFSLPLPSPQILWWYALRAQLLCSGDDERPAAV
jgi:hypothetical protein